MDSFSNNDFRQRRIEGKKISNKTHVSVSDPDATLSWKAGETKSLAYKTHHAIDASSRVIIERGNPSEWRHLDFCKMSFLR